MRPKKERTASQLKTRKEERSRGLEKRGPDAAPVSAEKKGKKRTRGGGEGWRGGGKCRLKGKGGKAAPVLAGRKEGQDKRGAKEGDPWLGDN